MKEKIDNRLDSAISNLDNDDYEKLFPLILDDLEYILRDLKKDTDLLTSGQKFMYGVDFHSKVVTYIAKLSKKYFKILYSIDVNIVEQNDYSLAGAAGGYSYIDDIIYYSSFGSILSKQTNLSFLHTCLHETRHKIQHDFYKSNDYLSFPPYMLRLLKENLLEDSLSDNNREFYKTNYDALLTENDAEIYAKREIFNFINNLLNLYIKLYNKSSKEMIDLLVKVNIVNNLFIDTLKNELFRINDNIAQQVYDGDLINCDYIMEKNNIDRIIILDKYIKKHSELQEKYPILKLLFNSDKPKTYEEIINDKNILKEDKNIEEQKIIDRLYKEIIILDPILSLTEKLEYGDTQLVKEYIELHPMLLSEYEDDINELFKKYNFSESIVK